MLTSLKPFDFLRPLNSLRQLRNPWLPVKNRSMNVQRKERVLTVTSVFPVSRLKRVNKDRHKFEVTGGSLPSLVDSSQMGHSLGPA